MSILKSVIEAEQRNGGPQEKRPLAKNENSASRSNQEQDLYKSIKRQTVVGIHPITVGVEAGADACGKFST